MPGLAQTGPATLANHIRLPGQLRDIDQPEKQASRAALATGDGAGQGPW